MPDATTPDPQDFIEYRLIRIADQLRRRFATTLLPHGLNPHQFSVLAALDARPSATAAELARMVLLTPQSMGALLDQLEGAGLLEPRPRRGRGVRAPAVLSSTGASTLAAALAAVRELDRETREVLGSRAPGLDTGLRCLEDALLE